MLHMATGYHERYRRVMRCTRQTVADSTQNPDGVFRRAQIFVRNAVKLKRGY